MGRVCIINQSMPEIGYVARTTTPGEEFEMVSRFLDHLTLHYSGLKRKNALVFLEPQIETGYPDIVIAEYFTSPSHKNETRDRLNNDDLRILFHIQQRKNVKLSQLSNDLGFSAKDAVRSVKRLSKAGLVNLSKKKTHVRNVPLRSYCTITRLISIERNSFLHYLHCLKIQCEMLTTDSYLDAYSTYEFMLNSSENTMTELKKRGMTGQTRDFAPALEANRVAMCANDEDYGFRLKLDWSELQKN